VLIGKLTASRSDDRQAEQLRNRASFASALRYSASAKVSAILKERNRKNRVNRDMVPVGGHRILSSQQC